MCRYGMPYRKSTRLLTLQFDQEPPFLGALAKKCQGDHEHQTLSGWGAGASRRPTRGTAEYPRALAAQWAQAAGSHLIHYD